MKDLFVNLTSPESEDHAVLDMRCRVFAVVGEDDGILSCLIRLQTLQESSCLMYSCLLLYFEVSKSRLF